jgi:hypothetical protein
MALHNFATGRAAILAPFVVLERQNFCPTSTRSSRRSIPSDGPEQPRGGTPGSCNRRLVSALTKLDSPSQRFRHCQGRMASWRPRP